MKTIKKIIIRTLMLYVLVSIVLLACGKFYYWKALVYNFAGIDDLNLFPSRAVKTTSPVDWNISVDCNKAALPEKLLRELEDFQSVAFLIIKDDSIQHERYWDGYTDSSFTNAFSMAKSIIGALTGIALGEGKIKSLEQEVGDFIPEFNNPPNDVLTIRHLLTMSSGLNWDESYSNLFSKTTESYYGKKLYKQMSRLKVVTEPGKNFDYMSCNTQLLGFVLRKATGKPVSEYASEKLWTPLNAMHAAGWSLARKDGSEKAYCCFYSNARDFARVGKLYLDSGRWNGRQIVPENFVLESITPAPLLDKGQPNKIYGYHWWLDEISGQKIFFMRGLLGQYVIVIPEKKIIIVRLGKQRDKDDNGEVFDYPLYVEEVLKMFP